MLKEIAEKFFPFLFSKRTYLAYGVEEAPTRYPLNKARYPLMASYIHNECLLRKKTLRVLDIGCSEGMLLLYCNKNASAVEFYGMDILRERLDKALNRGYKSVILQDIREKPFPYSASFFDVVICSHILEHLLAPQVVLEEVRRILKKDGLFIVGVPIGLLPDILWRRHILPLYKKHKRTDEALKKFGHVTFFTLTELRKLLKENGFTMEEARGDFFIRSRRLFLENYKWWYDFNQFYGKLFPWLWGHVTVRARQKD